LGTLIRIAPLPDNKLKDAHKLRSAHKLRDDHKAEFAKALDKVFGTTKDDELVQRATRSKAGQTWERTKKG
jgi:hypothetical protein